MKKLTKKEAREVKERLSSMDGPQYFAECLAESIRDSIEFFRQVDNPEALDRYLTNIEEEIIYYSSFLPKRQSNPKEITKKR